MYRADILSGSSLVQESLLCHAFLLGPLKCWALNPQLGQLAAGHCRLEGLWQQCKNMVASSSLHAPSQAQHHWSKGAQLLAWPPAWVVLQVTQACVTTWHHWDLQETTGVRH